MMMLNWLIDIVRRWLGHWLLAKEEAEQKQQEDAQKDKLAKKKEKQKQIVEGNYETTQTANDLDNGEF
jgi:hypothetical protein